MSTVAVSVQRSRVKQRLETILSDLCELERLKQKHECRVHGALHLGDSAFKAHGRRGAQLSAACALDAQKQAVSDCSHRRPASNLQCVPCGRNTTLEQQVEKLTVNTEVLTADSPDVEDQQLNSGEVLGHDRNRILESKYNCMVPFTTSTPVSTGELEAGETDLIRHTPITNDLGKKRDIDPSLEESQHGRMVETLIIGLIHRKILPTRPSKPCTNLAHDAPAVTVGKQSNSCYKEKEQVHGFPSPSHCSEATTSLGCHSNDQEHYLGTGFTEDVLSGYQQHPNQRVQLKAELYHRTRQAFMINSYQATLLTAPLDSSNNGPDLPQHFHNYLSPLVMSKTHQPTTSNEHLVNAEYIPAQACKDSTATYAQHNSNLPKCYGISKSIQSSLEKGHHHQQHQSTPCQMQLSRSRGGPKKCRLNDEKSGATRKQGKKACRSQSENSLQRAPERKYNTVERDGGGSGSKGNRISKSRSKKQQGGGNHRHWQSTLELSQDDADQPPMPKPIQGSSASNPKDHYGRQTRKSRPVRASYHHPHPIFCHHQRDHLSPYHLRKDFPHPGQGELESSMSEAHSPDSNSLSSDSDESGSLVWPQQLPPQLLVPTPPSPPGTPLQHKAFVKIKASHALKKKILRFRTGSLKVMTTV